MIDSLETFVGFLTLPQVSGIAEHVGWILLHSVWQFAAIALLAFTAERLLRRRSSSVRYVMLLGTLLLIVAAPVVTCFVLPDAAFSPLADDDLVAAIEHSQMTAADDRIGEFTTEQGTISDLPLVDPLQVPESAGTIPVTPAEFVAEPVLWQTRLAATFQPWLGTIVGVWCCGVLLFSVRLLLSGRTVRRLRTTGVSPIADVVEQAFQRVRKRLKITQNVQVLQSTVVNSPVVVGCFRSVILLPPSFISGVPMSQLEAILAHELAHVRRFDYITNVLQTLVETLFFYHPAVWWLSRQIRIERESCCDDLVVATLGNRVEYGRALLAVEELRGSATSLALSARGGSLLCRVRRLFADPIDNDQRSSVGPIGVGVLCAGLIVTTVVSLDEWTVILKNEADNGVNPQTAQ